MEEKFCFVETGNMIEVELPDGRIIKGPRGSTVEQFLQLIVPELTHPLTSAIVNNELRELSYIIDRNSTVRPVTTVESDGKNIYRRSLVFLLSATFEHLYPNHELKVDHSIQSGGLFCSISGPEIRNQKEFITKLESEMRSMVDRNLPIQRSRLSLDEAKAMFTRRHQKEKVHLLKFRNKPYLTIYQLEDFIDYHYGYMVPSTGYLKTFAIEPSLNANEFFLRYPKDMLTNEISPLNESPKMMLEFRRYGDWLKKLGIDSIASLNEAIEKDRIQEVILVSEALHDQKFVQVAKEIAEGEKKVKVVLIAGPSSSGKTTFSKRLSIELLALGISPVPIEMDDFFVDRTLSPKDKDGNYDFESFHNLNLPLLEDCVKKLIKGEEVQLPRYDFLDGKSKPGKIIKLVKDQMIILEGIHGLNPELLKEINPNLMYKIFVSPLTQLNVDRYNRVSTVDTRLIRRIVRDYRDRGYSAQETIARWNSVRAGEERNIFPYQGMADEFCNTSLVYELSALKTLAETALQQVPWGNQEFIEAKRLLSFLEWVLPLDTSLIPENSILAEFIGGSNLKNFSVWRHF
ncbi:nucleoside kinase [Flexilinea flocculi]|jgi:uridine kinase|uniref:Uridine kinase n=1 Tax=Flexilinea flocculi TaxID=1678840 RepID=A0A0S7BVT4_9CHLR|nr:nucleoside kinase [Flexilinea flocculi]NMB92816.1 TGS domain-containing protein [Flexilinea flocculi]GAP41617.1 uridine kinase [Flexilinea flocculi]